MATNLKNGGQTPSGMALRNSLNPKPDTFLEPMMLTPLQRELLRQDAKETVAYLKQSSRFKAFLKKIRPQKANDKPESATR